MKFSDLQLTTPYLTLSELFYDTVEATPLKKPYLISYSKDAAKLLGVLRLSPTWVRFGTFEYFSSNKEYAKVQELADYVIAESFAYLQNEENRYMKMYEDV